MDISALLSPSETPRASSLTPSAASVPPGPTNNTSAPSPFKHVQRAYSGPVGSLKHQLGGSPLLRSIQAPSSIPAHVRSPSHQTSFNSPLISPVPTGSIAAPNILRTSTQNTIDTLADLAASQPQQATRSTPPISRSRPSNESVRSIHTHLSPPPSASMHRASFDIAMVETQKELLRSNYAGSSLRPEAQQRLSMLVDYLKQTPSAYESHVEVIKILHQGFVDHIYPSSDPQARRDPRSYDLLPELRLARDNMDRLFAMGESQWLDWLQDESLLAQTAEERLTVIEKCRRATEEAYASTSLWVFYGDWMTHCYNWAQEATNNVMDEERLIGRDLFEWQMVLDTWTQAIHETKLDLPSSHLVWNKYLRTKYPNFDQKMGRDDVSSVMQLFHDRLRIPHAEWDQTFQLFSGFVSANYSNDEYESIMASTSSNAADVKSIYSARRDLEDTLLQAQHSNDQDLEYNTFTKYIEWEYAEELKSEQRRSKAKRNSSKLREYDPNLLNAVYQRAELRFPSGASRWEEHIAFMVERRMPDILNTLDRATKHCPWSGLLWTQYLLSSEVRDEPFASTEAIKHKATSTGLLDAAGIEETLKVHEVWCGYLLRRSRRVDATEEDSDVAEMGIRSSIEITQDLASKLGLSPDFDPTFRLQRKYVEYLKGQGRFDNARKQFDDAIPVHGKYSKFWLRFYDFEVQRSIHIASLQQDARETIPSPSSAPFAVAVLKQGLDQPVLDYPEALLEVAINHCEDFEDAEELQNMMSIAYKMQKKFEARKQFEQAQTQVLRQEAQEAEAEVIHRTEEVANGLHIDDRKRKRADDQADHVEALKRSRHEEDLRESVEDSLNKEEVLKRDREHASILVRSLPPNITETSLRQYFSNCGIIRALKIVENDVLTTEAIIEFEDNEAAQYALSRDGRELQGSEISVDLNTGSTLYITNYPAVADEKHIRNLLRPYGDIVSIRFPSLQGNKRRRFCYVEFKLPRHAQAALELDGKVIDDLAIVVKISNPAIRQTRSETQKDGHTVFVGQLPFAATSREVEDAFANYGEIASFTMPQNPQSQTKNKGIAFITFTDEESAKAALIRDGQDFQGRTLSVRLAASSQRQARGSVHESQMSKSPSVNPDHDDDSRSVKSYASDKRHLSRQDREDRRQRTVILCDVPDTVNESRLRALAENSGPVHKVILKTNHQGAILEFQTAADAGKASLELDGHEIDPGRMIRVTTEQEMLAQKPERKFDSVIGGKPISRPGGANNLVNSGHVRRPVQVQRGAAKRGGGHLGQKSATIFERAGKTDTDSKSSNGNQADGVAVSNIRDGDTDMVVDGEAGGGVDGYNEKSTSSTGKKTNDDFRAMIS